MFNSISGESDEYRVDSSDRLETITDWKMIGENEIAKNKNNPLVLNKGISSKFRTNMTLTKL